MDRLAKTQLDADRILLSIMQASLSLIGFGFTIYQIFSNAGEKAGLTAASRLAARVGISFLVLGLVLLGGGLWAHFRTRRDLQARRGRLVARGVLAEAQQLSASPIFLVATLLLAVALATLGAIFVRLVG